MQTIVRLPLFAVCGVAGFLIGRPFVPAPDNSHARSNADKTVTEADILVPATGADSSFIAEWDQLRATRTNSPEELPALYADIKDIKDAFRRRAFRSALIAEWAITNPHAALAYLSEKDKGMVAQLIREWLRIDPNAAISALMAGGEKQQANLRAVLGDIAKLAPEHLAQVASALPGWDSRWRSMPNGGVYRPNDTVALEAFATFGRKDLEGARIAAESVSGGLRGQALAGVGRAWAEKDGAAAWKWAEALSAGFDRDETMRAVLIGWSKTEPIAALERIEQVPPGDVEGYHASDVGAQVLREAGKKDWDATMNWLRDHPGKLGRSSLEGLQDTISHRLMLDPAATLKAISVSGVNGLDNVLANSLLNDGYARRDQVWHWLDQQPSNDFTKSVRGSVINAIAWKEPSLAMSYLDRLPDTLENRPIFERGVGSMLNGGSQMHLFEEFMENAPAKLRPLLLEAGFQYGLRESVSDPGKWIKRIDELPPERRTEATGALARGWAQSDPEAAVQWASNLSEGSQREVAFGSISSTWALSDPHAAAQWVDGLPAGEKRDTAARGLVSALCESQPETAWTWALSIAGEQARLNAISLAYMGLQRKNAEAAAQMLESANLPSAVIERLRTNNAR